MECTVVETDPRICAYLLDDGETHIPQIRIAFGFAALRFFVVYVEDEFEY